MNLKIRPGLAGITTVILTLILIAGYSLLITSCSDNRTIFQRYGNEDKVLHDKGLTQIWDLSVTNDNATVTVEETYYDKSRIMVGFEMQGLDYSPLCSFYYNGQSIGTGSSHGGLMNVNNKFKYAVMQPSTEPDIIVALPDKFDLYFVVKDDRQLNPDLQKVFEFTIPLDRSQTSASTTSGSPVVPPASGIPSVPGLMPPPGNLLPRTNVNSVQFKLVPAKTLYLPGELIQMEFTLTNTYTSQGDPITVEPYPPVIYLVRPGGTPNSIQLVKTFAIGNEKKTLATGEQVTYSLTWDQKDDNGKPAPPGWYNFEGKFNMTNNVLGKAGYGVTDRAFLIQYPQGATQRTIELNQSQTIKGFPFTTADGKKQYIDLVLTLKQVKLSDEGTSFMVVASSPNNPVSGYYNPDWMDSFIKIQDTVNGVTNNPMWSATTKYLDNGIELRWESAANYLNPVPGDSKGLSLVVTTLGDWHGRLEFQIPLK